MTPTEFDAATPPIADTNAAPDQHYDAPSPPLVGALLPINTVGLNEPLQWLSLGWKDFTQAPMLGLLYGLCLFVMGHALLLAFKSAPVYVLALGACFLMVGPFLSLGLYQISQDLQALRRPTLRRSVCAWQPIASPLTVFASALMAAGIAWSGASLLLFTLSFDTMPLDSKTWTALLSLNNFGFLAAYLVLAGAFAGLAFTTSVIALPMICDKRVDARTAGLTSVRACQKNSITMTLWAMLIAALVVAAMLTWFVGLLVIGPVLGHATWHAYQALVVPPLPYAPPSQ